MDSPSDAVALVLPPALLAEVEAMAAEANRPIAAVLLDLVGHGLEMRRWQVHSAGECQRAFEIGLPDDDQQMTEEYRQTIRERITEGLASHREGKGTDGAAFFAEMYAELDELERQGRE